MSKKQWLLAIIVGAFVVYLIISKVNPEMGWSIDNVLGGAIGNLKAGVEASSIWQQYDIYFSGAFFGTVAALLVYKGRDMYDGIRGIARVRATPASPVTWQGAPPASEPQPIYQSPQPQPIPTPAPVIVEPEKKEST